MRSIRTKLLWGFAVPLALLAAACGSDSGSGSAPATGGGESGLPVDVKLTLVWVTQAQFAGYYAALDQGYFKDENLNVTIQPGGPDINGAQLLISGDTDIIVNSISQVLTSRDAGADLVSIGTVFERGGYRLAYFDDAGINSVDDWKGKTVGLWFGFNAEVSAALNKHGFDVDSDVTVFNQGFDMVAFLDGQVDLASAMTYNEYAQALAGNTSGREILLWDPNEEGTAILEDGLITTGSWLAANPETAEKFIRASARGWIYCRDNPESCIDIVLKAGTALPRDYQTWQMNEINKLIWPSTNGLFNITPEAFKQSADMLLKYGVIKKEASTDAYNISARDRAVADFSKEDLFGANFKPLDLDPKKLFAGG